MEEEVAKLAEDTVPMETTQELGRNEVELDEQTHWKSWSRKTRSSSWSMPKCDIWGRNFRACVASCVNEKDNSNRSKT